MNSCRIEKGSGDRVIVCMLNKVNLVLSQCMISWDNVFECCEYNYNTDFLNYDKDIKYILVSWNL